VLRTSCSFIGEEHRTGIATSRCYEVDTTATLRLFFFGREPALSLASPSGRALLVVATLVNAALAWRSASSWLTGLALLMAGATALVINAGGFVAAWLPIVAGGVIAVGRRREGTALSLGAIPLLSATYFLWAIGNPVLGGAFHYVAEPAFALR